MALYDRKATLYLSNLARNAARDANKDSNSNDNRDPGPTVLKVEDPLHYWNAMVSKIFFDNE